MRWSVDLGWVVGPLMGFGTWWAEGRSSSRKPDLVVGSSDDAVWDNNFWLNRLLLAVLLGTFGTVLILRFYVSPRGSPLDMVGAFACGSLAWALTFLAISGPRVTERFREFRRFEQLRYGYKVPSVVFIVPASIFALWWIVYVLLHV